MTLGHLFQGNILPGEVTAKGDEKHLLLHLQQPEKGFGFKTDGWKTLPGVCSLVPLFKMQAYIIPTRKNQVTVLT